MSQGLYCRSGRKLRACAAHRLPCQERAWVMKLLHVDVAGRRGRRWPPRSSAPRSTLPRPCSLVARATYGNS
jgi:hypothetical protein